jgi:hypothetical protein
MNLKKSVGPSKTPFALSLSGEWGFGSHLLGECAVSRSCFDRLSVNGSLFQYEMSLKEVALSNMK